LRETAAGHRHDPRFFVGQVDLVLVTGTLLRRARFLPARFPPRPALGFSVGRFLLVGPLLVLEARSGALLDLGLGCRQRRAKKKAMVNRTEPLPVRRQCKLWISQDRAFITGPSPQQRVIWN
jgi:hypothetical protein